jgi:hypothetical protein
MYRLMSKSGSSGNRPGSSSYWYVNHEFALAHKHASMPRIRPHSLGLPGSGLLSFSHGLSAHGLTNTLELSAQSAASPERCALCSKRINEPPPFLWTCRTRTYSMSASSASSSKADRRCS